MQRPISRQPVFSGRGRDRIAWTRAGWAALGCCCVLALLGHGPNARAGEPATAAAARWVGVGKGVLEDTGTGLQWTAADNGADIDWNDAKSWCIARRFRWRLPTVPELLSIRAPAPGTSSAGVACGKAICQVDVEFKLSGSWFWSATPVGNDAYDGIEMAWGVQLVNGARTQSVMNLSEGSRALCVRNR